MRLLLEANNLASGVSPGVLPYNGNFWHTGTNVLFKNNGFESLTGSRRAMTTDVAAGRITKIQQSHEERLTFQTGSQFVYIATISRLQILQQTISGLQNIITVPITTRGHRKWSFLVFQQILYATNGTDAPYKLTRTGLEPLPDRDFGTCRILASLGPSAFAINIDGNGKLIRFSNSANFEDFRQGEGFSSGSLFARQFGSDITCAAPIGNRLAIYSRDEMGVVQFIGGDFIFGFFKLLDGIGAINVDSVVSLGPYNFGASSQGIWRTDGSNYQFIDRDIRDWLYREGFLDYANLETFTFSYYDEIEDMVVFYFPIIPGPFDVNVIGVGYNVTNQTWTILTQQRFAGESRRLFDYPLTSLGRNLIYQGQNTIDEEGRELRLDENDVPIDWSIQTKPLDLGFKNNYKRLQAIGGSFDGSCRATINAFEDIPNARSTNFEPLAETALVPNGRTFIQDREALCFGLMLRGSADAAVSRYGFEMTELNFYGERGGRVA